MLVLWAMVGTASLFGHDHSAIRKLRSAGAAPPNVHNAPRDFRDAADLPANASEMRTNGSIGTHEMRDKLAEGGLDTPWGRLGHDL
ncbi:hypothetical protein EVAR_92530_1 [Eumeta japonica]|uniref:Uncharacterized protein n=1 Tax=Eumeta variegata TaxID=151549 RepID=A0A4C1T9N4_EUMVA|nr:hypothetical protein EVAR_92530_1 [Eumeta japonica]